jgi:type IV pilus assembly protein PilW
MNATRHQAGFSIVELMIAMLLSVILMSGVLSIFASSKVTYLANERTARLQENGRTALDLIVRDIRSAGYVGCAKAVPFTSTLNTSTTLLWNYAVPMQGFESTGTGVWSPALDTVLISSAQSGSDVIVLRVAQRDGTALPVPAALASATANPVVANTVPPPVTAGQIMMITDCNASTVFQVSGYAAGAVLHSGGANPGNATNDLGYVYQGGARLIPLQTVIYYVRENSLWRKVGNAAPEALIDGIQALQIVYGRDTDADRLVDDYVPADSVTDWSSIVSVSLSLLARSEEVGTDVDTQTYDLLGTVLGPFNDRRQRLLFTTTAALRNVAI